MDGHKIPVGAYFYAPKLPSAAFAVPVALDRSFGIASCAPALTLPLSEHTSLAMDWPPNCCGRAPRSVRSASYWVTAVPGPTRSTSKWILMHCGHSPCRGREVCDEHSPGSCWGVLGHATCLGIQTPAGGQRVDRLRHFSRATQRFLHHSGVGACVGSATFQRSS